MDSVSIVNFSKREREGRRDEKKCNWESLEFRRPGFDFCFIAM